MKTISITGRLGQDPKLRTIGSGDPVLNLSVAVDNRVKENGEWVSKALWVDVTVFGKRGEGLSRLLKKGQRVAASGELNLREYEARDGTRRQQLECIANHVEPLEFEKREGEGRPEDGRVRGEHRDDFKARRDIPPASPYDDPSDNIPF